MAMMCRTLGVSRSGFYTFMNRKIKPVMAEQVVLEASAKETFENSSGTYGSRRMAKELQKNAHEVGRHAARSLMKNLGLRVVPAKRFKVTTDSKHNHPVAPNLLNREFNVERPDTAWVGDITYIWL